MRAGGERGRDDVVGYGSSFFVGRGVEWRTDVRTDERTVGRSDGRTDGRVKFAWTLVCVSNFTHAHIQQQCTETVGASGEKGSGRAGARGEAVDNKRRRFRHKSRPRIPTCIFASEQKKGRERYIEIEIDR